MATSLRVASFYNSGQECGAACRVLVHESVVDEFVDRLVAQVRELVVGVPEDGRDLSIYALDDYSRTKHVMHYHGR